MSIPPQKKPTTKPYHFLLLRSFLLSLLASTIVKERETEFLRRERKSYEEKLPQIFFKSRFVFFLLLP